MIEADVIPRVEVPTPEQLAQQYGDRVLRWAAMVCANPADCEDLAQDALVKAMRGLGRFRARGPGDLEAWLWRIVANTARDAGRRESRRRALWERLAGRGEETVPDDVESLVLRRIDDEALLAHVRRLPHRHRTVLALRFGADLSYDEMAAVLGERAGTLRQTVRRALQRLHAQIEEEQA